MKEISKPTSSDVLHDVDLPNLQLETKYSNIFEGTL